jgi:hypothetical protein
MSQKNQPQSIELELRATEAEGIYANFALITHSPSEFVLDFARLTPGVPKARIHARIIMTPQNLKSLHRALAENIMRYEAQFGPIPDLRQPEATVDFTESAGGDKTKLH